MSSWAIVCNVWFLEPQKQMPGESAIQFTERVKLMICNKAKITPVPWDGYYKYTPYPPNINRLFVSF